jgi:hypothetical protein
MTSLDVQTIPTSWLCWQPIQFPYLSVCSIVFVFHFFSQQLMNCTISVIAIDMLFKLSNKVMSRSCVASFSYVQYWSSSYTEEKEFYFEATYYGMTWQVRPFPEATIPAPEEARFWAPSRSWVHLLASNARTIPKGKQKSWHLCWQKRGHWVLGSQWIAVFESCIYRRETLLLGLLLDAIAGSNHWFICCDPVSKLCQQWFTKEVFCRGFIEPLSVVCEIAQRLEMI